MWTPGNQKPRTVKDFNYELSRLQGELPDDQAKILITKFLLKNLGFTLNLFAGIELLPVQELILKGILIRDNSLIVCARGFGKSFLISILSIIYPIFNPNSKLCLISSNFRNARRVLEYSEKIVNNKKAELLQACFPNSMRRGNDIFEWKLDNGASVFALPLSSGGGGEGLRGVRSNATILDEYLLVPKEIVESVIRPFLTVKQNPIEEMKIKELEDDLIKRGAMEEKDRISFPRNKFVAFSSASYQFEHMYEVYTRSIDSIMKPEKLDKEEPTFFTLRASYEALPENSLMDMSQINAAKANGGENSDYFKREYRALFTDSSDSYFNVRKMNDSTFKAGEFPTTQIKGEPGGVRYILSIDPSYSSSKTSDFFAMGVFLLNETEKKITLVHSYGRSGGNIADHYIYLTYILTYFNIVFICIDGSGTEFINGYNESIIAKEKNINLDFLTEKLDAEDYIEYTQAIKSAKVSYNLTNKKIVWAQNFNGMLRRMNENMQNMIDSGKLWFASPVSANEAAMKKYKDIKLPFESFKNNQDKELGIIDFIEEQDNWIKETKSQIALIEIKSTTSGSVSYDLPQNLRQQSGINRVRRDNYTTTLLGTWSSKIFIDLFFAQEESEQTFFTPIMIR